jgi:hypothetical protein
MLASPIWLTFGKPRTYLNFGVSLALGILLLVLGLLASPSPRGPRR